MPIPGEAPVLSSEAHIGRQVRIKATTRRQRTPFELHAHEFFEIEYIYSGGGYQLLNGVRHALRPGSMYLLTPMDVHELYPEPEFRHYNVMFSEEFFSDEFAYDMLLSCRAAQVELTETQQPQVRSLFDQLVDESGRPRDAYAVSYMRSLLQCLLITLLRSSAADTQPEPDIQSVRKAQFYLQRHFRDPVTLHDVASHVHLSPNYFCGLFRQATGVRFSDYVNDLRVRCAHRLLTTGTDAITDICFQSGFHSFATFSRAFQKRYRQSPSQLRKAADPAEKLLEKSINPSKKSMENPDLPCYNKEKTPNTKG